jgi:hypothetical protein
MPFILLLRRQDFIFSNVSISIMGKMNVVISDKTEKKFREAVARHLGFRKGNISRALEEAIDLWIKSMEDPSIIYEH